MRLIDAEAFESDVRKRYCKGCDNSNGIWCGACWVDDMLGEIEDAHTIEAKPVVFCKDCKYNVANSIHDPLDITDYTDITCEYFMTDGISPDDYCSQGVKIPVISIKDVPKIAKEMENDNG